MRCFNYRRQASATEPLQPHGDAEQGGSSEDGRGAEVAGVAPPTSGATHHKHPFSRARLRWSTAVFTFIASLLFADQNLLSPNVRLGVGSGSAMHNTACSPHTSSQRPFPALGYWRNAAPMHPAPVKRHHLHAPTSGEHLPACWVGCAMQVQLHARIYGHFPLSHPLASSSCILTQCS